MMLPIRPRLAFVCAALVATLIVALGAIVYLRLEGDLLAAVDDELRTRAETLIEEGESLTLEVRPTDVGDVFAQRVSRTGQVVATTPGIAGRSFLAPAALGTLDQPLVLESVVSTADEQSPVRLVAMPADDGTVIIAGVTIDDQRATLATLLLELGVALPVAVILAGAVGWVVAGAALRPVERMRREAEAISASEPGRRLPVPGPRDELAALGTSLNRMLDRLQAAVERERRLLDDASHELRTPLANLKAELDLALRRSRTEVELISALRSAAEETDRLTRLAEDLLVLARADAGRLPIHREDVDMGRLVRETVTSFRGRVADLGLIFETTIADDVTAWVDPIRVQQVLANLIDNAIRHTPRGGRVVVTLHRGPASVTLRVTDTGDGFPPAFLQHAFEPFSRSDAARSRTDGGAGLGLAIVRAVAEAHGGTAEASNRPEGGASVAVRIPSKPT
jgi:heavy metal sensor kinase